MRAGPEAVYVFFILSGLVLTLPALRRSYHWKSYYPSRLVRLYLPVIGAVVFAMICVVIVPRSLNAGHGTSMDHQEQELSIVSVIRNMTVIAPDALDMPLWSLRWEIAFSVLLPVYIFIITRLARWWPLVMIGSVALSAIGGSIADKGLMTYLPMFLLGSALAVALQYKAEVDRRAWPLTLGVGLIGITASWWLPDDGAWSAPVVLVSALFIVWSAIRWPAASRFFDSGLVRWFGKISFSLYLTHAPIVIAVNALLPLRLTWWTPVIAIPLAILVGALFFAVVEAPAHRLSKRVRLWVAARSRTTEPELPQV